MGKSNKIKRFKKEQVMEQQKKGLFGRRTSPVMWILILLSSIMLSLPFLLPGTGWVSLVAFIPLLAAEHIATRERMRLFWVKYYLCFLLWNIFTTFWIYKATLYGAMAAVILNALQMAVIFAMFRWFKRLTKGYLPYLFFIIAWLAWEHAYFNWDVSWPWLVLGNAFATSVKSVQWYEYTGALGGSLWILLINTLLFRVLLLAANGEKFKKSAISVALLYIVPVVISLAIYHSYKVVPYEPSNGSGYREFTVLQPNIDPYNRKFSQSQYQQDKVLLNLMQECDSNSIVVAPETFVSPRLSAAALVENNPHGNSSFNRFGAFAKERSLSLIIGAVTDTFYNAQARPTPTARHLGGERWYDRCNSAVFFGSDGRYEFYHKSKLVVLVESTPYKRLFKFVSKFNIDLGGAMGDFAPQSEREIFVTTDSVKIGTAICYESVYGDFYREYVLNGADVMSIITNDGWWGDTPGYRQHLSYASLRAIETRRAIARSANTGISAFIDQKGDIIASTEWWKEDAISADLPLNDKITFFVRHGDIIGRVSEFLYFLFALMVIVRRISRKYITK